MDIARGIGKLLEEMEKVHAEIAALSTQVAELDAKMTVVPAELVELEIIQDAPARAKKPAASRGK